MHYNDLWVLDPCTNAWSEVKTQVVCDNGSGIGIGPSARRRQSCCLIGSKLYLFGGTSPIGQPSRSEFLPESRLKDQNDLHILDFSSSLETLSKLAIVKHKLDTSSLPPQVQMDVEVIRGDPFYRDRSNTGTG